MPFIAFLGCDGSGKSAVIAEVEQHFLNRGVRVHRGHWRPTRASNGANPAASAEEPHGQPPRGLAGSIAKLACLWAIWWLEWWRSLARHRNQGLVIFDRYHADLLVDPKRYRYGAPMLLARIASALMPQPDRVFFLDAPEDVLLSRKQEVPREALTRSRSRYLAISASQQRIRVIDASQPLDRVVADVLAAIPMPGADR